MRISSITRRASIFSFATDMEMRTVARTVSRIVALNDQEYLQMAETSSEAGLAEGAIYNAVVGHCALKSRADILYTWNIKDFLRLPPAISSRVRSPE
jgi:predicted nucleic acid-binding protein